MMIPGLLILVIFNYIPILGNVIAFMDYQPLSYGVLGGILRGDWVGFAHFKIFFDSIFFERLIFNTIWINLLKIIFSFPLPILFAIFLNELQGRRKKKVIQTISSFPHFISWVIVGGLIINIFTQSGPFVREILPKIGINAEGLLTSVDAIIPMIVISTMWKGFGWGAIIYLAAITGINPELYEAASVDGANRFRQIWHIMLPGIAPVIIIMLLLNIGNMLNADISQFLVLVGDKAFLFERADVIDTYVYRAGMISMRYSFTAAVGLFKAVIATIMILGADRLAKALGQDGLW